MFQDLTLPYDNSFSFRPVTPQDFLLIFCGGKILAKQRDGEIILPTYADVPNARNIRYAFSVGEAFYYLASCDELPGYSLLSSRQYRTMSPAHTVFACAVGESLRRWYDANRFCGRCACPMEHSKLERAMVCPKCNLTVYPKISPAVIVAICNKEKLLLTKYAGSEFKRYALVAGFNEIGESIEQTVHREVMEETGLRVKNLRFYKSQPWVFTDSLLIGFFCDLDGSDTIHRQEEELSEAAWFLRDALPYDHSPISLTGEMIERFRSGLE